MKSLVKLAISSEELRRFRLINRFSMRAHGEFFFSNLYVALHRSHVVGSTVFPRLVPTEGERITSGLEGIPPSCRIAVFLRVLLFLIRCRDIAILRTVSLFEARRGLRIQFSLEELAAGRIPLNSE